MRAFALLAVLSLLLAGCSDDPASDGGATASASSSTTTSTGPPPKPVVLSDELHLLEAPAMAPALSASSSEVRTPTATFGGGPGGSGGDGQGPSAQWEYLVTAPSNVSAGEIHIWIEIVETLVQFPVNFPPTEPACTWFLTFELGADNDIDIPCLAEPVGPINPGTKELVFSFLATDPYQMEVNETILLRFGRSAFSASQNPAVYILSGSVDHDSRAVLTGLKEPVPEE